MKKIQAVVIGTCMSVIAAASLSPVYAGNRPGATSVTVGGAYEWFASKRNVQNTGMPFATLGYTLSNHWGVEGFLGAYTTKFKNSVHDSRHINGTLFAFDAVYNIGAFRIVEPFVTAGVGITSQNPSRYNANSEGNINAGLGANFFFTDNIAFRADVRDFYTWVGGKNDVLVDAGINFFFGGC